MPGMPVRSPRWNLTDGTGRHHEGGIGSRRDRLRGRQRAGAGECGAWWRSRRSGSSDPHTCHRRSQHDDSRHQTGSTPHEFSPRVRRQGRSTPLSFWMQPPPIRRHPAGVCLRFGDHIAWYRSCCGRSSSGCGIGDGAPSSRSAHGGFRHTGLLQTDLGRHAPTDALGTVGRHGLTEPGQPMQRRPAAGCATIGGSREGACRSIAGPGW